MPRHYRDPDSLAAEFGFAFERAPLDFLRPPGMIAERKGKELELFLKAQQAARAEAARREILGPESVTEGTVGASPTEDPEGAIADLRVELGNEERQRAIETDPMARGLRRQLKAREAGLDPANVELARSREALADIAGYRRDAIEGALAQPDLDPLLALDITAGKTIAKPELFRAKRRDGSVGWFTRTRNLAGGYDYAEATDPEGNPLLVPDPGMAGGADRATALQKNTGFLAQTLGISRHDAAVMLTQLKGRPPTEAWDSLTRTVLSLNYGRYARDAQRLYEKTAEVWRVARPGEPVPPPPPKLPVGPSGQPGQSGQPSAAAAAPLGPSPGGGGEPAPAVPPPASRRAGQVYQTPRGPLRWTGTGWLPAN